MAIKSISLFLSLSLMLSAAFAEDIQLAKLSNADNKFVTATASSAPELSSVFNELDKRLSVYPKDHEAELLKSILYFRAGKLV